MGAQERQQAVSAYLKKTVNSSQDFETFIPARFRTKNVRFLVGTHDTFSCNRGACQDSCAAMTTGSNRLQRALNFKSYLEHLYPNYAAKLGLFDAGHDGNAMFNSDAFINWAFVEDPLSPEWAYDVLTPLVRDEGKELHAYDDRFYPLCECKSLCNDHADCNSFSYDRQEGNCYLKSKCVSPSEPRVSTSSYSTYFRRSCRESVPVRALFHAMENAPLTSKRSSVSGDVAQHLSHKRRDRTQRHLRSRLASQEEGDTATMLQISGSDSTPLVGNVEAGVEL